VKKSVNAQIRIPELTILNSLLVQARAWTSSISCLAALLAPAECSSKKRIARRTVSLAR
jgi:hypothetical protein